MSEEEFIEAVEAQRRTVMPTFDDMKNGAPQEAQIKRNRRSVVGRSQHALALQSAERKRRLDERLRQIRGAA